MPAQAPDTVPRWIDDPWTYAPETIDTTHEFITGHKLKNVVMVWFRLGTTLLDRQLAIDRIDGEVVGGIGDSWDPDYDGLYLVRIPHDGTLEPLRRAVSMLNGLPQVAWVGPYFLGGMAYPLSGATGAKPFRPVPPRAPDTIPQWIRKPWTYAPEAIDTTGEFISGDKLKNVVMIVFRDGTTLVDRQLAIDRIDGVVVGGIGDSKYPDFEGLYLVRIPHDGTVGPLRRAIETLDSLPQVSWSGPYFLDGWFHPLYRKSRDGQGWQQWQVLDTLADNQNWGPQAISTPTDGAAMPGSATTAMSVLELRLQTGKSP